MSVFLSCVQLVRVMFIKKHRKRTILHDSDEESLSENGPIQSSCNILPKDCDADIHDDEIEERDRPIDDDSVGSETDQNTNRHGEDSFTSD